ncbi:hypothetical protein ACFFRR_003306 [Megaselia abdita]
MKILLVCLVLGFASGQQYQLPAQSNYNSYQYPTNSYSIFSQLDPNANSYNNYYPTPINPAYPGYSYTTVSPYYNTYSGGYSGYNSAYPLFNWLYPYNYNGNANAGQQQVFGRRKRSIFNAKLKL